MRAFIAEWAAYLIGGAILVILVLGLLQVRSCQQANQRAAQGRVDQGQARAAANSAQDALATQGNVAESATAAEQLTAQNREDIRNAQGADAVVDPAARDAGFRSLCKRTDFRNSPTGRVRCPSPSGVAPAR